MSVFNHLAQMIDCQNDEVCKVIVRFLSRFLMGNLRWSLESAWYDSFNDFVAMQCSVSNDRESIPLLLWSW